MICETKDIVFWYRHQQAGHEWKENVSKHMLQCSQACVFILTGVHSSYQLPPAWAMCPLLVNTGTGPVSKLLNYNQQIRFLPRFTTHGSYGKLCIRVFLFNHGDDSIIFMWTRTILQTKINACFVTMQKIYPHHTREQVYSKKGSLSFATCLSQLCGLVLLFREKYS